MSMFRCNECQAILDSDTVECMEDPRTQIDLVCMDCYEKLGVEDEVA